jgi:predicted metalloprotease with PDZ domain
MFRAHQSRFATLSAILLFAAGAAVQAQPRDDQPQGQRGYLGVFVGPAQGEKGAMVGDVTPDSPAAKAGLKRGDRIVKMDDKDVRDPDSFLQAIGSKKPGDQVKIGVMRDDKEQTLTATIGERPNRFPGELGPQGPESRRIRDLERRIEELEKRVRDLEKK